MRLCRTSKWMAVGTLLAAVLFCAPADLQALQAGPERGPGPRVRDQERQKEIQETIEIYMITKMKRYLDLSDEQERTMIPLVEELNTSRREIREHRHLTMRELRSLIEDEAASEDEIESLLADLDAIQRDFRQIETRAQEEIRETLTPRQQAQFLVFQERFHREMRHRMRRLERGEGPGGERPRPGQRDKRRPPR